MILQLGRSGVRGRAGCLAAATSLQRRQRRGIFSELGRALLPDPGGGRVKEHQMTRVVPYTPAQLYDVVADVNKYKEFVPFCEDSVVLRPASQGVMMAQLSVGFKVFTEKYTSRIRLDRPNSISIVAVDSRIFNSLESSWIFKPGPTPNSTKVRFSVKFEVANPMASAAIDVVFSDVVQRQIQAFEDRCAKVYKNAVGSGGDVVSPKAPPPVAAPPPSAPTPPSIKPVAAAAPSARETQAEVLVASVAGHVDSVGLIHEALARHANAAAPSTGPFLLDIQDFQAACTDLSRVGAPAGFAQLSSDPVLVMAIFSSLHAVLFAGRKAAQWAEAAAVPSPAAEYGRDDSALGILMSEDWWESRPPESEAQEPRMPPEVWRTERLRELAQALHVMVEAGMEERAAFFFRLIDRDQDGCVTRAEVEAALRGYLRALGGIIPVLINRRLQDLAKRKRPEQPRREGEDAAVAQLVQSSLRAVEVLLEEAKKEVPLAVEQILSETGGSAAGKITLDKWKAACAQHPDVMELMTLRGMSGLLHWANTAPQPDVTVAEGAGGQR